MLYSESRAPKRSGLGLGSDSGSGLKGLPISRHQNRRPVSEFVARHWKVIAADLPLRRSESEPRGGKRVGGWHGT